MAERESATLVNSIANPKREIQVELLRHLYREDLMAEVFDERPEVLSQPCLTIFFQSSTL